MTMHTRYLLVTVFLVFCSMPCLAGDQTHQSTLDPAKAAASKDYPRIVLYSVAWCPHCRETKEYFAKHNIPFINRDVEMDAAAMEELTVKYKSSGVPVIVIGSGKHEVVVKGFTPESFQNGLKKARGH